MPQTLTKTPPEHSVTVVRPKQSDTPAPNDLLAAPHAVGVEEVTAKLRTHPHHGLDHAKAAELIEQHGYNELAEKPPEPWWKRLARQFNDLTIWVLLGAAVLSLIFGDLVDALAILGIVVLNGLLGFFQEERAGRA